MILTLALVAVCLVCLHHPDDSAGVGEMPATSAAGKNPRQVPAAITSDPPVLADVNAPPASGRFSPEMARLIGGIHAGIPLRVRAAGEERSYVLVARNLLLAGGY